MSTSTAYQGFLERLEATPQARIHLGLEVMRQAVVQETLQRPAPTIVTVAGTNGKGTVASALSQLCTHRGLTTTLLTSPHLVDFRERIRVDGLPVAEHELMGIGDRILARYGAESDRDPRPLSYFELSVLLGLAVAQSHQSDVLIMEVGLGGRFDATNVIDADISVFTSISIDHTELLGDTIDAIAFEKSQIARQGKPALYHAGFSGVEPLKSHLHDIGALCYETHGGEDARTRNLALAADAFSLVESRLEGTSSTAFIQQVFDDFQWPGRLSWIESPAGTHAFVDGAHNAESSKELRRALDARPTSGRVPAVVSLSGGRQVEDIVAPIAPYVSTWHVCAPSFERAMPSEALEAQLRAWEAAQQTDQTQHTRDIVLHATVAEALAAAEAQVRAMKTGGMLVFGSLYLVADVYAAWRIDDPQALGLSKTNKNIVWQPAAPRPSYDEPVHGPPNTPEAKRTNDASSLATTSGASSPLRKFLNGRWFPSDRVSETDEQRAIRHPRVVATAGAFSAIFVMVVVSLALHGVSSIYFQLSAGTIIGNLVPALVILMIIRGASDWKTPTVSNVLRALWMGLVFSLAGTFLTGFFQELYTLILQNTPAASWWESLMSAREASYDNILGPSTVGAVVSAVLAVSVFPGIFEEFLFRGVLYRVMRSVAVWRRIVFIGVLFSLIHFDVVGFVPLVVLGVVLTWLRALSGSWAYSAVVHIAFNGTALLFGLLSGPSILGDVDAVDQNDAGLLPVTMLMIPALLYSWYLFRNFGRRLLDAR